MSIGTSGRIVLEIDPNLKKELYQVLIMEGIHLKQWFLYKLMTIYRTLVKPVLIFLRTKMKTEVAQKNEVNFPSPHYSKQKLS